MTVTVTVPVTVWEQYPQELVEGVEMTQTFNQTCDKPYTRHHYKLVYDDGREVIFDDWEGVQVTWFQRGGNYLSHVEVLDIKEKRGFK